MTREGFNTCSIAERAALVEAWRIREKRVVGRMEAIERANDRRFASLMAVTVNAMRGTTLSADDFLKGKRRRRKYDSAAAAERFFAPLVKSGVVKEETIDGSN